MVGPPGARSPRSRPAAIRASASSARDATARRRTCGDAQPSIASGNATRSAPSAGSRARAATAASGAHLGRNARARRPPVPFDRARDEGQGRRRRVRSPSSHELREPGHAVTTAAGRDPGVPADLPRVMRGHDLAQTLPWTRRSACRGQAPVSFRGHSLAASASDSQMTKRAVRNRRSVVLSVKDSAWRYSLAASDQRERRRRKSARAAKKR